MRQVVYVDPTTGVITMTLKCDLCDERGWVEGEVLSYDPRDGQPIMQAYKCNACQDGYVDSDFTPRSEADLIEENATLAAMQAELP